MVYRYLSIAIGVTLLSATGLLIAFAAIPQEQTPKQTQDKSATGAPRQETTPNRYAEPDGKFQHAYHKEPPTGPLPATLDPTSFASKKTALISYAMAAKIRELLYQVPCYCSCDKFAGHQSLLDCFTSDHGTDCGPCQRAAIFVYEQQKMGRSVTEIRNALDRLEFGKIDLKKYGEQHYDEYKQAARK